MQLWVRPVFEAPDPDALIEQAANGSATGEMPDVPCNDELLKSLGM